jgi:hypothetical protein
MGLAGCVVMRRLAHGSSDRAVSEEIPSGDGHGVVAARVPRMATSQTFRRKPTAVERPESPHGLQSVMGAGGMEAAARAQEGAHEALVNTN